MKKKMTEIFISEKGNALILVVLLVLCMMLIAGGVMAVSFSHVEISQAYKKTSNLYYAAQSGAEKMVDHINKLLLEKMPELMEQASNEAKEIVAPRIQDWVGIILSLNIKRMMKIQLPMEEN